MKVHVISVGKRHDPLFVAGIEDYSQRVAYAMPLEWDLLPPSGKDEPQARLEESAAILARLKQNDVVWLLDERGEQYGSLAIASKLDVLQNQAVQRLVIVIGGAYGVDDQLRQRADLVWSLSKLVFPHQLVRLILAEQLYRATQINRGSGYHHA